MRYILLLLGNFTQIQFSQASLPLITHVISIEIYMSCGGLQTASVEKLLCSRTSHTLHTIFSLLFPAGFYFMKTLLNK